MARFIGKVSREPRGDPTKLTKSTICPNKTGINFMETSGSRGEKSGFFAPPAGNPELGADFIELGVRFEDLRVKVEDLSIG